MSLLFSLAEFVENPDNPQTVTEEAFARLVRKLKRVPESLYASRIAYVTDHSAGKRVVISGNKRLRALKAIYGESALVSCEWFQDVTSLTQEQRDEFIVDSNVVEGRFDANKLIDQYENDELSELLGSDAVDKILDSLKVYESPQETSKTAPAETKPEQSERIVKLKIELSPADYAFVVAELRKINKDINLALATLCGA
jgi:hypothetical protein